MRMATSASTAGTALPPAPRYCGFAHQLCTCLCPNQGLIRVLTDEGPEFFACTCKACTAELVTS